MNTQSLLKQLITNRGIFVTCISMILTGCAAEKAYDGPSLPISQVSRLEDHGTTCVGMIDIKELDNKYSGNHLEILPGQHTAKLGVVGEPYRPDDPKVSPYAVCMMVSTQEVTFSTAPGKLYHFALDRGVTDRHALTFWESLDADGPKAKEVPAEFTQLTYNRFCTMAPAYTRCAP